MGTNGFEGISVKVNDLKGGTKQRYFKESFGRVVQLLKVFCLEWDWWFNPGMLPDGSVLEQWTVSIVWWFRLPPKSGPNVFMVQLRNKNKIKHKSWSYNKGMSSRWKSCKVVQVFPIFMSQLVLKLVSAIFTKFYFFHQMIALQKLWKMLFISSKKLFSFSRYSVFCISVLPSFSTCQPLL